MGGGGGINPLSIISTLVFGPEVGGLVGMVTAGGPQSGAGDAPAAGAEAGQQAEAEAAEARRRADRQKAEAALLARSRQAERADLASQDGLAQSLGAPSVAAPQLAASQLKERLGQ